MKKLPATKQVRGWRLASAKNASKKSWKRRTYCKYCGLSLAGASPIKPFSEVYMRLCRDRDYDMCERHKR